MDTSVELEFGDGRYRFWLPMAQIVAIEAGERSIMEIWSALSEALAVNDGEPVFVGGGAARFSDVVKVIRHGLIGGGECLVDGKACKVGPLEATRLVETYVHNRPIVETLPVAWVILQAAIFGIRLKKKADDPDVKPPRSRGGKSSRTAPSLE